MSSECTLLENRMTCAVTRWAAAGGILARPFRLRKEFIAMRIVRTFFTWAGLLAAACSLAGCGATPHNPDTAGASGVTVYGTADVGVGRVRR